MAKRFTDTEKYKKKFIRGLQGAYKLLWDYLYHDCDHAGIWYVDFEIAQIYLGQDMPVNEQDALRYFNNGEDRIIPLGEGKKWFIPSFIEFQYGILNPENRAHFSVLNRLERSGLNKGLLRALQGRKDKDKEDLLSIKEESLRETKKPKKVSPVVDYPQEIEITLQAFPLSRQSVENFIVFVTSKNKTNVMLESRKLSILIELKDILTATNDEMIFQSALNEIIAKGVENLNYLRKVIESRKQRGISLPTKTEPYKIPETLDMAKVVKQGEKDFKNELHPDK